MSSGSWFDLMRKRAFRDVAEVREAEQQSGQTLSTHATLKDARVISRYEARIERVRRLPQEVRKALLATSFHALGAFQSRVFLPLRAKLLARGIDSPSWFRELW